MLVLIAAIILVLTQNITYPNLYAGRGKTSFNSCSCTTHREVLVLSQSSKDLKCSWYHAVIALRTNKSYVLIATICLICLNLGKPGHEPKESIISAQYLIPSIKT